jgi:hypothetical protein
MNIKKIVSIIVLSCLTLIGSAQNGAEGVSIAPVVTPPDPSAMLDVQSSNKGILIPRVNLTSATDQITVPSPVKSLMVFNEVNAGISTSLSEGYYYWDGVKWTSVGGDDNVTIKHKIVNLGAFDLAIPGTFGVSHGLPDHTKILDYKILINHDISTDIYCISYMGWNGDGTIQGSITTINSINVGFSLRGNSIFKNGEFSSLSISRGKVFITYYE